MNRRTPLRRRTARPRRRRVVLADRRGPRRVPRTITELEEQTSVGEVLVDSLVRAQLRTAALAACGLGALAALPLVFWLFPQFATMRVLGVPLAWPLLGVVPYPLLVLVGWFCTRRAERHERDFVDMVER